MISSLSLAHTEVADWPGLAWLATMRRTDQVISVLHGRLVETAADVAVEAVWPGQFEDLDFDRSDIVMGTGLRLRGDAVHFISSSDVFNRLHHFEDETGRYYISNSLPALLAYAGLELVDDFDYGVALDSIERGLSSHVKEIPSSAGPIHLLYFHNLVFKNGELRVQAKASTDAEFTDFESYRRYLLETARRVGENGRSSARHHAVAPLATVSKGYDSPVAAIVAKAAGADTAATIATARRHWGNLLEWNVSDSGADVARQLGLACRVYPRIQKEYRHEDAIWSAVGNVGDLHFTSFEFPEPLCVLFTGFGGSFWESERAATEPLQRKGTWGTRFCECRLELGVFVCAPAFWGCQKEEQISALARREEMQPWTLGGTYDRPIPRRFLEEAGVCRGTFAVRKQFASFNHPFGHPISVSLRADFDAFMRRHGGRILPTYQLAIARVLRALEKHVLASCPPALRIRCGSWIKLPSATMFFLWANERRIDRYATGLRAAGLLPGRRAKNAVPASTPDEAADGGPTACPEYAL